MAIRFAQAGADVVVAARTLSELEQTAAQVRPTGRKCVVAQTDVTRSDQVNAMAQAALRELGRDRYPGQQRRRLHQGYGQAAARTDRCGLARRHGYQPDQPVLCCRAVLPQMVKQERGKIINIASGWGLRGGKRVFTYAAPRARCSSSPARWR